MPWPLGENKNCVHFISVRVSSHPIPPPPPHTPMANSGGLEREREREYEIDFG